MIDLVGFDLVLQLHRLTVADLLNRPERSLPGGGSFHLFGGPHPIELPLQLDLGIPTTLVVGGFAQHELVAVPGTATMRLATRLTRLALQVADTGAVIVRDLAAGARVDVPVALTPPPDDAFPGLAPEVRATLVGVRSDLATAVADLAFDTASHARIANAQVPGVGPFGTARTDALEERLRSEFEAWVRGQGPQWSPLGAAALRVVEGVDSAAVTTLASWPTAQWVDADTFGVFGHHVAAAVGGAPGQKAGGDLASPGDERLDVTTRLLGRVPVPAHRFSIEVSADSVLRFMVIPALREQVVRRLVQEWRMRDFVHAEEMAYLEARFNAALRIKSPADAADIAQDELDAARRSPDHVAGFRSEAAAKLAAHLGSPQGQAELTAATPPPYGSGVAHSRVVMPDPFSDVIADVTRIAAELLPGRIAIDVDNEAETPVCAGRMHGSVGVDLRPRIDPAGAIVLDPVPRTTTSELDGLAFCTAVLAVLGSVTAGPVAGVAFAGLTRVLTESLVESIAADTIGSRVAGSLEPVTEDLPSSGTLVTRPVSIAVDRPGLGVVGLVATDPLATNDLHPHVRVDVTRESRSPSLRPQERGTFHKERSCLDGGPRDFGYTRRWSDETWRVQATPVDMLPPVTFSPWTIRLGDTSARRQDPETGLLDALWVGEEAPLTPGVVTLPGPVLSHEPVAGGPGRETAVVTLHTTEQGRSGWLLAANGTDGDFALLLRATATDGDGARHPVIARVFVDGTRVIFDAEADAESRACLADLASELDKRGEEVVVIDVAPWRKRFEPWQGVELDPKAIRLDPGSIRLRPGPQL